MLGTPPTGARLVCPTDDLEAVSRRYQVPSAAGIRKEAGIATAAVGVIAQSAQAEDILVR